MNSIVSLSNVTFRYGTTAALENVTLSVEAGVFVGLIGPNGGGKSTLLKLLLGLEQPQSGTVRVFGEDPVTGTKWRSKVGHVPQQREFTTRFPVSAEQVVSMGLLARGLPEYSSAQQHDMTHLALHRVGMEAHTNKTWWTLSGGQKQRVLIARALVHEPELLLLDEPTVGVDARGQDQLNQWLSEWRTERNLTVILVSHDIGAISPVCDRLACLNVSLHFHDRPENLSGEDLEKTYGCPAELVFHDHSLPHRVVGPHEH
ncbi:MAG: metal ABC transporter ATP-binding protein [bacterium]|nr:metal ABC transporter ATP-binding protein [bacterium]